MKNGRHCLHLNADFAEWSHLAVKTLSDDGQSCDAWYENACFGTKSDKSNNTSDNIMITSFNKHGLFQVHKPELHTYAHPHTQSHIHTHVRTQARIHETITIHTHPPPTHTHVRTYVRTHTNTHILTHTHTHTHIHTHTYTHTHTQ